MRKNEIIYNKLAKKTSKFILKKFEENPLFKRCFFKLYLAQDVLDQASLYDVLFDVYYTANNNIDRIFEIENNKNRTEILPIDIDDNKTDDIIKITFTHNFVIILLLNLYVDILLDESPFRNNIKDLVDSKTPENLILAANLLNNYKLK